MNSSGSCGVDVIPVAGETVVGIPVGTVIQYASATAPAGYLNCDGSAISRTTYGGLFGLIGTTYGAGNGASIAVTSWSITSGAVTITATNPYIVAGSIFVWDNGAGGIYSGLVATIITTPTSIVALISAADASGTGGSVRLTTPTTFNLPNTVGVTIRGSGTSWNIGSTGGADSYALTSANIASHKHDITIVGNGTGAASGGISTSAPPTSGTSYTTGIIYDNTGTQVTAAGSNGSSFSTLNKYLVLHYCIKY